jgi:hypothetical protein
MDFENGCWKRQSVDSCGKATEPLPKPSGGKLWPGPTVPRKWWQDTQLKRSIPHAEVRTLPPQPSSGRFIEYRSFVSEKPANSVLF